MDELPENYVTPLRTSLTRPILMAACRAASLF